MKQRITKLISSPNAVWILIALLAVNALVDSLVNRKVLPHNTDYFLLPFWLILLILTLWAYPRKNDNTSN